MKLSVQNRLLWMFLLAITITGLVSAVVGAWMIGAGLTEQAQVKARLDLNSARLIYRDALAAAERKVEQLACNPALGEALQRGQTDELARYLEEARRRGGLDFLDLLDNAGKVVLRARAPDRRGDSLAADPVVRAVHAGEPTSVATAVMSSEELRREAEPLAERARIALASTPEAREDHRTVLSSGLVIKAAAAVKSPNGERRGMLLGARLLNRDITIVDQIRQTVYQGERYHGREVGAGTLCLGDVRIATNARLPNGERAVGTRVDRAVSARVLGEGRPYVAVASVVSERHITGYEAIRDASGQVVGILSLGIPEERYTGARRGAFLAFFGVTLGGVLLAVVLSGLLARRFSHPLHQMVEAVRDLAQGNLRRTVQPDPGIAEFRELGEGFNSMARALEERDLQLKYRTQETVGKAERLAMIGRLAAGVAHEINNPLGGIMLFSNLLLRKAPPEAPERENLQRICNEAKRCQRIVQGLLDFSRRREPKVEPAALHELIDKTLQLVENQALFQNVELVRSHDPAVGLVRVDIGQIQQVLINLVMNAVEAMQGKGTLTICTQLVDEGAAVQVDIRDTGCGIAEEHLDHLFEPFFTTKEVGQGTGLGLSISRGIVENHGGSIWATSKVGEGTTFSFRLRVTREERQ